MFTVSNPLGWLRSFRSTPSGLAEPQPWLSESLGGTSTLAGESVSVTSSLGIADVFAAVNLIAEEIGSLPLKVYRDLALTPGNPGEGIDEAPEHRAWRLLHDMPNPYTPANRFWSTVAVHQLLWGNWFIEKLRDEFNQVAELRLVHPSTVQVYWNEAAAVKAFQVTRQSGRQEVLDDTRMLHGFGVSQDGIIGMSPIQQAREALGIVKARERFEGDAYGNHPYAGIALETPGSIKDPKRIRESWRAVYGSGSKDRGGVAVLEEGMHANPLPMPMADMQFVETVKLSKTQIANIFKLPPSYIGGSVGDSLTYQTVESNKIWLASQTLSPIATSVASYLSHDPSLFPFPSWFCKFDLTELTQGDSKARADYWKAMKDMGVVDAELIAEREGLPPPPEPDPVPAALTPFAQAPAALNGDAPSAAPAMMAGE